MRPTSHCVRRKIPAHLFEDWLPFSPGDGGGGPRLPEPPRTVIGPNVRATKLCRRAGGNDRCCCSNGTVLPKQVPLELAVGGGVERPVGEGPGYGGSLRSSSAAVPSRPKPGRQRRRAFR